MDFKQLLICPKCGNKLILEGNSFLCKNRHCYDMSKDNYVNLLLCNQKKSKNPGDDKMMVSSRNIFLQKGYFNILRKEIEDIIDSYNVETILDAGCGTGYYTYNLQNKYSVISIDISKEAVFKTVKNNKKSFGIVASIFNIPLTNSCVDIILNIFAPKPKDEFKRILKNNGLVIEVIPGKLHMKEIKDVIYNNESVFNKEKFAFDNFQLKLSKHLTYTANIKDNNDILDLIKMTPYFYSTDENKLRSLKNVFDITITFDFIINLLEAK